MTVMFVFVCVSVCVSRGHTQTPEGEAEDAMEEAPVSGEAARIPTVIVCVACGHI